MPSGTTVKIFAPRLHKQNATDNLKQASETMSYIEKTIIFLVGANSNAGDASGSIMAIDELLDDYRDAHFNSVMSDQIIMFPEDCEDELE
jgi:hypothetical protein|tara:strand:- start:475 stop:744 length:270 start_codon:yes stop_codon:yes gene_type:complete